MFLQKHARAEARTGNLVTFTALAANLQKSIRIGIPKSVLQPSTASSSTVNSDIGQPFGTRSENKRCATLSNCSSRRNFPPSWAGLPCGRRNLRRKIAFPLFSQDFSAFQPTTQHELMLAAYEVSTSCTAPVVLIDAGI